MVNSKYIKVLLCPTEYQALQKALHNLKLPTEILIAKYYKERHDELLQAHSCIAELVVRVGAHSALCMAATVYGIGKIRLRKVIGLAMAVYITTGVGI